jgi:hypothetical protein
LQDYELLAGGRALTENAMCGQLQHSITACVYFLTPHRVKKVDLIMMSALSQLVSAFETGYFAGALALTVWRRWTASTAAQLETQQTIHTNRLCY